MKTQLGVLIAGVLSKLSNFYRANRVARGLDDPGHVVLEMVLVVSAGLALVAFLIWFFFLAGAEPLPVGIKFLERAALRSAREGSPGAPERSCCSDGGQNERRFPGLG